MVLFKKLSVYKELSKIFYASASRNKKQEDLEWERQIIHSFILKYHMHMILNPKLICDDQSPTKIEYHITRQIYSSLQFLYSINGSKLFLLSLRTPFFEYLPSRHRIVHSRLVQKYTISIYCYLTPLIDIFIQKYTHFKQTIHYLDVVCYAEQREYLKGYISDMASCLMNQNDHPINPYIFSELSQIIRKRNYKIERVRKSRNRREASLQITSIEKSEGIAEWSLFLKDLSHKKLDKKLNVSEASREASQSSYSYNIFQEKTQISRELMKNQQRNELEKQGFGQLVFKDEGNEGVSKLIISFDSDNGDTYKQLNKNIQDQQQQLKQQAENQQPVTMERVSERNRLFYAAMISPAKHNNAAIKNNIPSTNVLKGNSDKQDWQNFYRQIKQYTNKCQNDQMKCQAKEMRKAALRQHNELIERKRTVREKAKLLLQRLQNEEELPGNRKYHSIPKQLNY